MNSKIGWAITAWLVLALAVTCASANGFLSVPILVPVLVGLGVPTIVLLWEHREHLHKLLSNTRH
ncbi:MAG: hypothetical protein ABFD20_04925 [Anaerolineales bacterium]